MVTYEEMEEMWYELESIKAERDKLKEQVEQLKSELEISKKEAKFVITDREKIKITEWVEAHNKEKHKDAYRCGVIGGIYTYCFTPSELGVMAHVECSCGDSYNFRQSW